MRFRRELPHYKPEKGDQPGYSEFEEEIKPPVQKHLIQIVIATLALTTIISVIIAKVSSDQNQQATHKVNKAVSAQSTAEAQVTALVSQVNSMMATLLARGVISGVQTHDLSGRDSAAQMRSRELAYVALTSLADDPERSILIALEADQAAHTPEVEDALRRALQASHMRLLLSQPGAKIRTAEFSPNGALIVTTNSIGEARVWNANDGELGPLLRGAGDILSAQFSPDGRFILTLSSNQTATVWDALTGSTVSVLAGHGVDFTAAQFGSSADIIALGGTDGNVRIWYWYAHGISNTEVFSGNIGSIRAVELSTDRILATGNTGLTVWDRWSGGQLYTEVNVLTKTAIWDAHLSYGSLLVLAGSADVRILDTNTGQVIHTLAGTLGGDAQFSPDGDYMLVDGVLWNLDTGQVIARFPREYRPIAQFSPNGRYLLMYNDPHTLTVWDMRSGPWPPPLEASIRLDSIPHAARFSPNGQTLVTVDLDGVARVWAVQPDDNLPSDYQSLVLLALRRATRSLTCLERQTYLHDTASCDTPTP